MNIQDFDILNAILNSSYTTQRDLVKLTAYSLGTVNKCLKNLKKSGYLNEENNPTDKTRQLLREHTPEKAIILAAGYGMRMVPINTETPKGLLKVHGEPLIERLIAQLHQVNITDIYVVVGFMKEQYEYLIDAFGVKLIVNTEYSTRNNLYSLNLASDHLENAYVIPCDLWCSYNPFRQFELFSWYMVNDKLVTNSNVRVNRKQELIITSEHEPGNSMLGISYITKADAALLKKKLTEYSSSSKYDTAFWELALYGKSKLTVQAKLVSHTDVIEINTYEQLREIDSNSGNLKSDAIETAANALNVDMSEIKDISVLKKGMTNRSFLFTCRGQKYIMRIPGEGTEYLINRKNEALVYNTINNKSICDDIIYINADNGYKITKFIENTRVCDPYNDADVCACMKKLREFHSYKIIVPHRFDLFKQIDFYESLWGEHHSIYRDYYQTKKNVLSLRPYVEAHVTAEYLTHIDAVPDNFLFESDASGKETVRLIDWEYASMQDQHVDIAMFVIYSFYDKAKADRIIDIYFEGKCDLHTRIKIYCYIAICGLLWSNWCEYKRNLGVDFGEYSLKQYRYAKEFFKIARNEINKAGENNA